MPAPFSNFPSASNSANALARDLTGYYANPEHDHTKRNDRIRRSGTAVYENEMVTFPIWLGGTIARGQGPGSRGGALDFRTLFLISGTDAVICYARFKSNG
jgi:hypothetical protein